MFRHRRLWAQKASSMEVGMPACVTTDVGNLSACTIVEDRLFTTADTEMWTVRRVAVQPLKDTSDVDFAHGYVPDTVRVSLIEKHFAEATRCVNVFSRLPEGAELYIDLDAAKMAHHVIGLMKIEGIPAPDNVFSHSGDAVVFRWKADDRNAYLTVHTEGASILKAGPDEQITRDFEFSDNTSIDNLLGNLSGASWKSASST